MSTGAATLRTLRALGSAWRFNAGEIRLDRRGGEGLTLKPLSFCQRGVAIQAGAEPSRTLCSRQHQRLTHQTLTGLIGVLLGCV